MSARSLAIGLAAVAVGAGVGAIVLLALSASVPVPDTFGFRGRTIVFAFVCAVVGLAIAFRQPRNTVAWIFLGCGACAGASELAGTYAGYAVLVEDGRIPGGDWGAWAASWMWLPPAAIIPVVLPLVFPDGRLPSRRWRPLAWYAGFVIAGFVGAGAVLPNPLLNEPYVRNPVSPFPDGTFSFDDVQVPGNALLLVAQIASIGALVVRFGRSRGVERLQLKWFVYASAYSAALLLLVPVLQTQKPFQIVAVLSLNAIPIAAGIAILRYRLYDIDLLINRTLVYGVTSAAVAATFFAGILGLPALLRPLTGGSEIAIALSTLASFALVQPIRGRVQDEVDRRFYRSRYDAAHAIDAFSMRLRGDVDLDSVRADLIAVIYRTLHPAHASVWLRRPREATGGPSPLPRVARIS